MAKVIIRDLLQLQCQRSKVNNTIQKLTLPNENSRSVVKIQCKDFNFANVNKTEYNY